MGLLDLKNLTKKISVAGQEMEIFPLTINDVGVLMQRYQGFSELMKARKVDPTKQGQLAMEVLAPDAIAYCIVACTGGAELTNKEKSLLGGKYQDGYAEKLSAAREAKWAKAQEVAKKLSAGDTLAIFDAMFPLTFPDGVGPFVTRLMAAQRTGTEMQEKATALMAEAEATLREESLGALQMDTNLPPPGMHRPARSRHGSTQAKGTASVN